MSRRISVAYNTYIIGVRPSRYVAYVPGCVADHEKRRQADLHVTLCSQAILHETASPSFASMLREPRRCLLSCCTHGTRCASRPYDSKRQLDAPRVSRPWFLN